MSTSPSSELGQAIIEKAQEQLKVVLGRTWPDIQRILTADEEITIGMKLIISDRKATTGEQAEKDGRLRLSISFSEKYSDAIESQLPDPAQGELDV
jgi:hypothetical protein